MKILIGGISHETNTFSVLRTSSEVYRALGMTKGPMLLERNKGVRSSYGAMIDIAERRGVSLIPMFSIGGAGPLITKEALEDIHEELLGYVKAHQGEYDGICLALHGAGCAEGVEDLESYTVRAIRGIVGDAMPITVSLDLHGNISDELVSITNGLFGCKEYPHIDMYTAGERAMSCLLDQLQHGAEVDTAHIKLPLLLAPSIACTFHEPLRSIKEYVESIREKYNLYDTTFFHGFPYSDISLLGSSVIVVGKKGDASKPAEEIADWIWERRHTLVPECPTVEEAVAAAIAHGEFPVVINEASDNPGGGAPADGTHLLKELIRVNYPRTIFGFINDPEVAVQAHKAGVGAVISIALGGKTDTIHGETLHLDEVLVCSLSNGEYVRMTPLGVAVPHSIGLAARLRYGNVEIIVGSVAVQTRDEIPFFVGGTDFRQYNIVAMKSTNHFRAFFEKNAKGVFTADPPGIHTANFSLLTYRNLPRPIFPIDDIQRR